MSNALKSISRFNAALVGVLIITIVVSDLLNSWDRNRTYLIVVSSLLQREAPAIHQVGGHLEQTATTSEKAWVQFAFGSVALRLGRIEDARNALEKAWSSGYHRPVTVLRLGEALWAKGEQEAALATWRQDQHIASYFRMRGDSAIDRGDLVTAEEAFSIQTNLELVPTDALIAQGKVRYAQERWDEAYQSFARAANLNPNLPLVHYYLGMLLVRTPDSSSQAYLHFRQVLQLNPDFGPGPYLNLGLIERQRGNYEQAAQWYQKGVERFPDNKLLWLNYAINEFQRKAYQKSLALLERVDVLDTRWHLLYYWKARNYFAMGDHETTIRLAEQSNRLAPSALSWNLLGDSYQALGRIEAARAAYQQALNLEPGNTYAAQRLSALSGK